MLGYLISMLLNVSSLGAYIWWGIESDKTKFLIIITTLSIIINIGITIAKYLMHISDYIALNSLKEEINMVIQKYPILCKEVEETSQKLLTHELEFIKCISPGTIDTSSNNSLSHNLLTQLPKSEAITSVKGLMNSLDNHRNRITERVEKYNDKVSQILTTQSSFWILTPVPKYKVNLLRLKNLNKPEECAVEEIEKNL